MLCIILSYVGLVKKTPAMIPHGYIVLGDHVNRFPEYARYLRYLKYKELNGQGQTKIPGK